MKTSWDKRYEQLVQFKLEHGHVCVPQKWAQNPQLGAWVNKQRVKYKLHLRRKGPLTEERVMLLQDLGFNWGGRKAKIIWDEKYAELKNYNSLHGDSMVPTIYKTNPPLGRWVSAQRRQYKLYRTGEKSSLNEERIAKLEKLNFAWSLHFTNKENTNILENQKFCIPCRADA